MQCVILDPSEPSCLLAGLSDSPAPTVVTAPPTTSRPDVRRPGHTLYVGPSLGSVRPPSAFITFLISGAVGRGEDPGLLWAAF